jgi:hypothetical protein
MRSLAMRKLSDEMEARYPGIVIGGVGDPPHQLSPSDHNEDDTIGSKPAQTDPDSIPEHRAIDPMLGPSFSVVQAYAFIAEVLASPINRQRLKYINFENWQWSRSTNWMIHDNSDDPHPDHVHLSGLASEDNNDAPWLTPPKAEITVRLFVIQESGKVCASTGVHWYWVKSPDQLHALCRVWGIDLSQPDVITSITEAELPGLGVNAEDVSGGGSGDCVTAKEVNAIIRDALENFAQGGINAL